MNRTKTASRERISHPIQSVDDLVNLFVDRIVVELVDSRFPGYYSRISPTANYVPSVIVILCPRIRPRNVYAGEVTVYHVDMRSWGNTSLPESNCHGTCHGHTAPIVCASRASLLAAGCQ